MTLKELRQAAGITQVELAVKSKVGRRKISNIEIQQDDIRTLTIEKALRIADVLGVTLEQLINL